jgi:putative acetyltransferase
VDGILRRAFPLPGEAELVARLRREAPGSLALVAEQSGRVIGYILFSAVSVDGAGRSASALGLGPMAVEPDAQRRGVGAALARAGLEACSARGAGLVFVLGHPTYYPRFGFRLAAPLGLWYREGAFDRAFFVIELRSGAAAGLRGRVRYHPAFDGL